MAGLALLFLLALYVLVATLAVRGVARAGLLVFAWLLAAVFVVSPFADALAGRRALAFLCQSQAKVTISRTVVPVEGIRIGTAPSIGYAKYYGYQYVEGGVFPDGRVDRSLANFLGQPLLEHLVAPMASYALEVGPLAVGFYITAEPVVVREIASHEALGGFTWYYFRGGWVERIAGYLSDAGPASAVASCGSIQERHSTLVSLLHQSVPPRAP